MDGGGGLVGCEVRYFFVLTLLVLPLPLLVGDWGFVMREKMFRKSKRADRFIVALWMAESWPRTRGKERRL